MSSPLFEAMLARLYTDDSFRRRFAADPRDEALRFGLTEDEADAIAAVDMVGLTMAAESYRKKRARRKKGDGKKWTFFWKFSLRSSVSS